MEKIDVLLIDDEENLLNASKLYLEKMNNNLAITTTNSIEEALSLFNTEHFDVIISDYQMQGLDGLTLLKKVRQESPEIPFIIFTGKGREEVAIEALNLGADYYLQKGGDPKSQFRELMNLIEKSFERKKSEVALRKSEEKFYKAFQYSLNSIILFRIKDRVFLDVNNNFTRLLKYERPQVIGKSMNELHLFARPEDYIIFEKSLLEKNEIFDFETLLLGKDARIIPVQISASLIDIEGETSVLVNVRDISEISQIVEELRENEQRYRFLFNESPFALIRLNLFDLKTKLESFSSEEMQANLESLEQNPLEISKFFPYVKILELNKIAKEKFGIEINENVTIERTLELLSKNVNFCRKALLSFIKEDTLQVFEEEVTNLRNEKMQIIARFAIAQGSESNWSKILLSLIDISYISKVKSSLSQERKVFKLLANAAIQCGNIKDYCKTILEELTNILNLEYGSIRIFNNANKMLEPIAIHGFNELQTSLIKPISIEESRNLINNLKEKEIIIIQDVKNSDIYSSSKLLQALDLRTYVFCPLLGIEEKYIGSITLGSKYHRTLSEEDKDFFNVIAEIISTIFQKII